MKNITKPILIIPLVLVIASIGCGIFSQNILRPLMERQSCYSQVAERIGVASDLRAIKEYIDTSLQPGMSREEVENILATISPLHFYETGDDNVLAVQLEMCRYSENNLRLNVYFADGMVKYLSFDD